MSSNAYLQVMEEGELEENSGTKYRTTLIHEYKGGGYCPVCLEMKKLDSIGTVTLRLSNVREN